MTPERFCDWLQGFVEIADTPNITHAQWQVIKDHLGLVFNKVTPDRKPSVEQIIKDALARPDPIMPPPPRYDFRMPTIEPNIYKGAIC